MATDIDEIPDYVAYVTSHFFTFYLKPFKAGAVHTKVPSGQGAYSGSPVQTPIGTRTQTTMNTSNL